jgi:hypothetical protein
MLLFSFRTNKEKYGSSPMFGINLSSKDEGNIISIGDEIFLDE